MGYNLNGTTELSLNRVVMTFTTTGGTPATGISPVFTPTLDARSSRAGWFNVAVFGTFTTATVVLERTFDGGTTWLQAYDEAGAAITFTAAGAKRVRELEAGVYYRLRCSVYTTVTSLLGRMSQ